VVPEPEEAVSAGALWGDNMAGDAKLKVGMPIRVEIGLETASDGMDGFVVSKLEPGELDRNSAYGTLATCDAEMNCAATVTTFTSVRVFDSAAMWSVTDEAGNYTIEPEPIGSEINATGKAVYGYNLRVAAPGTYTVTFHFPNVEITSYNYGTQVDPNTVALEINVIAAGGGGGGKNR
jgi:hypothetical protein